MPPPAPNIPAIGLLALELPKFAKGFAGGAAGAGAGAATGAAGAEEDVVAAPDPPAGALPPDPALLFTR